MRVVDTSAWIEWMLGSSLGRNVEAELPSNGDWIVPTIVQYELARWMARELPDAVAAATIAFSTQLVVKPLDTALSTKAADYSRDHKLAMAELDHLRHRHGCRGGSADLRRAFRRTAARCVLGQGSAMNPGRQSFLQPTPVRREPCGAA